jgi:hypothetical protein
MKQYSHQLKGKGVDPAMDVHGKIDDDDKTRSAAILDAPHDDS